MSLFIGDLAFAADAELADSAKIGVLAGSLAAGLLGFLVLRFASSTEPCAEDWKKAEEIFCCDREEQLIALPAPPEPALLDDQR